MRTPRKELRALLVAGHSMSYVESCVQRGLILPDTFARFERLWAVSTATEHPYTARWTLERWRSRRAAVTAAVLAYKGRFQL